jgi:uncharacterized protein (TIGR02466 family)
MNLLLESCFSTPIWKTYLNIDISKIIPYLYQLKLQDLGAVSSNRGGWHSGELPNVPQEHIALLDTINEVLIEVHRQMGLKAATPSIVTSHWYNINSTNSYNVKHLHPKSVFSGVLYLQVPEGNCGNITFYRENMFVSHLPEYLIEDCNVMTSSSVTYKPEKAMLIIFPSWIEHDVSSNLTTQDRISFSFNTTTHYL